MTEVEAIYDLVVVGASAGGIQAFSTLLATLPAGFPAPIVIAQHLGADRPSHLADILQWRSALPVRTVADATPEPLEPGVVYVVPADRDVEITDHQVHLQADSTPGIRRAKPSINLLLSSAARAYGERLLAVILSGTGSDGAIGAREVKAAGGTVIIQNPGTAEFGAMPASLAPNTVDVVADVEQIGSVLAELLRGVPVSAPPEQADGLQALIEVVRARSGIDFAAYKRSTIVRRLQRRLVATNMPTVPDYTAYLASHPDEYQRLIASFLINVTEFFRDPAFFTVLREQVLPELVAYALAHGTRLRLWSAGCATGEEAYSLAILMAEVLGAELEQASVQIFATDLDSDAIAFARRGVYPATALAALPEELITRAFTVRDGEYEVNKQIRNMTVFGVHDLGQQPAFPQIDLILCRNVLIYFTSELQRRVLHLFAYSLREGGYLALGTSEETGLQADLFTLVDPHVKLYRRHGPRIAMPASQVNTAPRYVVGAPLHVPPTTALVFPADQRARTASEHLGESLLDLPMGVVAVDRHYDVRAINAAAHRLLGILRPAVGEDLIHLAERVPSVPLRGVIDAAFRPAAPPVTTQVVTMETALGERSDLQLACYPPASRTPETPAEQVVLFVTEVTRSAQGQGAADVAATAAHGAPEDAQETATHGHRQAQSRARRHVQEVQAENARLLAQVQQVTALNRTLLEANQEQTTAILELRQRYEALVISHEEEQASAEEIKTLNEELQASNEELLTVNEELEATVEELHHANEELRARTLALQLMTISRDEQQQVSEVAQAREVVARELAEQLDLFFSMATHDIRSPLTALMGSVAAARTRAQRLVATLQARGGLDVDVITAPFLVALDNIEASSERLLHLVTLLFDVALARTGMLTLDLAPCELGAMVREQVVAQQAAAPGCIIELDLPEQPIPVMADADRLRQVLTNYLTNALKYSPAGQPVAVRLEVTGGKAVVSVQDHGPGLPELEQRRVWELYHRSPGVTVQASAGPASESLGLGLYICKRVVEQHPGGQVGVDSVVGQGSTFWFRLPLAAHLASDAPAT